MGRLFDHLLLLPAAPLTGHAVAIYNSSLFTPYSARPNFTQDPFSFSPAPSVSFLARAVRLGYNVLMLDSDVLLFGDVYGSLKAPPLGNATLLAMRDGNGW